MRIEEQIKDQELKLKALHHERETPNRGELRTA